MTEGRDHGWLHQLFAYSLIDALTAPVVAFVLGYALYPWVHPWIDGVDLVVALLLPTWMGMMAFQFRRPLWRLLWRLAKT
ncbi:MAG: hypothetical protein R3310_00200 [Candidatus Competibacteraceae bacterium]|nr:hypothetical protein [Candidatus Competibacteraceae bacterium]